MDERNNESADNSNSMNLINFDQMPEEQKLEHVNQKLKTLPDRRQPNYCDDILQSFNFKGDQDPNADVYADSDPYKKLDKIITF